MDVALLVGIGVISFCCGGGIGSCLATPSDRVLSRQQISSLDWMVVHWKWSLTVFCLAGTASMVLGLYWGKKTLRDAGELQRLKGRR